MSASERERLRALAEAATPGPWAWDEPGDLPGAEWAGDTHIHYRLLRAPTRYVLEHAHRVSREPA